MTNIKGVERWMDMDMGVGDKGKVEGDGDRIEIHQISGG